MESKTGKFTVLKLTCTGTSGFQAVVLRSSYEEETYGLLPQLFFFFIFTRSLRPPSINLKEKLRRLATSLLKEGGISLSEYVLAFSSLWITRTCTAGTVDSWFNKDDFFFKNKDKITKWRYIKGLENACQKLVSFY